MGFADGPLGSPAMSGTELIPTQLVGSWCKPQWLADHDLAYGPEGSWWRLPAERLPEALDDAVRLAVYDAAGRQVALLVDEVVSAGEHRALWQAEGLPSGVYFYWLQTADRNLAGKAMLVK